MAKMPADLTAVETTLRADLQRWAEAGEPSFDLGARLASRTARQRTRLIRWTASSAAAVVLATGATLTFPSWAAAAANLPIVGEPIKAYLAERAGLSWAYKMGFIQGGTLAELSDGKLTVQVLGVLADPIRTKVFYKISGFDPNAQLTPEKAAAGPDAHVFIEKIDGEGIVSGAYPLSDLTPASDRYYIAEAEPLTTDKAVLTLHLAIGDQSKSVELPVSRSESAKYFKELAVGSTESHGPVSINVEKIVLSPAEVAVSYFEQKPDGPADGAMWRSKNVMPYLKVGDQTYPGRNVAGVGWHHPMDGYQSIISFPRVTGKAQLVIPSTNAPEQINARWDWAPGTVVEVGGVPVKLEKIEPNHGGKGLSVEWTYPADSKLQGLGGFTVISADGKRYPLSHPDRGVGESTTGAFASVTVELPDGVQPAAIEVSHATWRVDGPWTFDLPELPKQP